MISITIFPNSFCFHTAMYCDTFCFLKCNIPLEKSSFFLIYYFFVKENTFCTKSIQQGELVDRIETLVFSCHGYRISFFAHSHDITRICKLVLSVHPRHTIIVCALSILLMRRQKRQHHPGVVRRLLLNSNAVRLFWC